MTGRLSVPAFGARELPVGEDCPERPVRRPAGQQESAAGRGAYVLLLQGRARKERVLRSAGRENVVEVESVDATPVTNLDSIAAGEIVEPANGDGPAIRRGRFHSRKLKIGESAEVIALQPEQATGRSGGPDIAVRSQDKRVQGVAAACAGGARLEPVAKAKDLGSLPVETDEALIGGQPNVSVAGREDRGETLLRNAAFASPTGDGEARQFLLGRDGRYVR